MNEYIGYIRVSTVKQGTQGVSLTEQRDAILQYAERHHFSIGVWLQETETAAKQGRPIFSKALKLLRSGKACGLVLHKLDRGARNLKDWAALGELSDQGVEIHFVTESLDLQSRGGRLAADIQAVVAADYIRNLREETRKGFYGRLKQGLYPLRAPLGYLDNGKGKAKSIDPVAGPLVRKTFELYGSARFSLETLGEELHRQGLRNRCGGRVTRNGLSTLLNNSFYIGLIKIEKTGEHFPGIHPPLITKSLFDRVQAVLAGKITNRCQRHSFLFRRMLSCATCQYSLIGERQKGIVYYRCHSKACPKTSVREGTVEAAIAGFFEAIHFSEPEQAYFGTHILKLRTTWASQREEEIAAANLRLGQIKDRLNRLTDAFLDGAIDKSMLEERKNSLLHEQRSVQERLAHLNEPKGAAPDRLQKFLELADNAWLSYQMGNPDEKRELVKMFTSNRAVAGKNLDLKPSFPFQDILNRTKTEYCDLYRDGPRTLDGLIHVLSKLEQAGELPDLKVVSEIQQRKATAGTNDVTALAE